MTPLKSKRGMAKATFLVFALNLVARVSSFARQLVVAMLFGATGHTDANGVAGMISGTLGMLYGPLATGLLPTISARLAKNDRAGAARATSSVVTVCALAVACLSVAGLRFAPALVNLAAPGLRPDATADAVTLTRVYLASALIPLVAVFARTSLNAAQRFAVPAASAAVQNVAFVAAIVLLAPITGVSALAYGAVLGGLAALMIQVPGWRRTGTLPGFSLNLDETTRGVFALSAPLMIRSVFMEVHSVVDRNLASRLAEGSASVLGYAGRLRQIPMGVFVTSLTTVMFPSLSAMWDKRDRKDFRNTVAAGLRYAEFVCLPCAALLMVLAEPLVRIAYQRGAFTPEATAVTAGVLVVTAPGLIAQAAAQVTGYAFYSARETRIPVALGIGAALLNTALDLALVGPMGIAGIALAHTVGGALGAAAGLWLLAGRVGGLPWLSLAASLSKTAAASTCAALAALRVSSATGFLAGCDTFGGDLAAGGITLGSSILVFVAAAYLLGCDEMTFLLRLAREKLPHSPWGRG